MLIFFWIAKSKKKLKIINKNKKWTSFTCIRIVRCVCIAYVCKERTSEYESQKLLNLSSNERASTIPASVIGNDSTALACSSLTSLFITFSNRPSGTKLAGIKTGKSSVAFANKRRFIGIPCAGQYNRIRIHDSSGNKFFSGQQERLSSFDQRSNRNQNDPLQLSHSMRHPGATAQVQLAGNQGPLGARPQHSGQPGTFPRGQHQNPRVFPVYPISPMAARAHLNSLRKMDNAKANPGKQLLVEEQQLCRKQPLAERQAEGEALPENPGVSSAYKPGKAAERLNQYMFQQRNRPKDNNIEFWRNLVAEFFAPSATKRWCVSQYKNIKQIDSLFKGACGQIFLHHPKAAEESVHDQVRIVRCGQLRVIFSPDLKICSWEFCTQNHEEYIPRSSLVPPVCELGAAVQDYQLSARDSSSVSPEELQSALILNNLYSFRFVSAAHQMVEALGMPFISQIGIVKRYVRCLQMPIHGVACAGLDSLELEGKTNVVMVSTFNTGLRLNWSLAANPSVRPRVQGISGDLLFKPSLFSYVALKESLDKVEGDATVGPRTEEVPGDHRERQHLKVQPRNSHTNSLYIRVLNIMNDLIDYSQENTLAPKESIATFPRLGSNTSPGKSSEQEAKQQQSPAASLAPHFGAFVGAGSTSGFYDNRLANTTASTSTGANEHKRQRTGPFAKTPAHTTSFGFITPAFGIEPQVAPTALGKSGPGSTGENVHLEPKMLVSSQQPSQSNLADPNNPPSTVDRIIQEVMAAQPHTGSGGITGVSDAENRIRIMPTWGNTQGNYTCVGNSVASNRINYIHVENYESRNNGIGSSAPTIGMSSGAPKDMDVFPKDSKGNYLPKEYDDQLLD
ncbi:Transcriptional corepressor SEUSS [Sesamum angolense]|uniref:Transcriptional corepressor SEUSS n=1 Tax=Sesamum angolense TaxID=2727404 RepID=A0AAE1WI62_9LAMI|nr:Transcriptional corepressor SEUSS [Sesamum angolense]